MLLININVLHVALLIYELRYFIELIGLIQTLHESETRTKFV